MPCNAPLEGYPGKGGRVTFIKTESISNRSIPVPCGQCMACRITRTQQWATRIMHEAQMTREAGKPSTFVTLTYSEAALPTDLGLQKRDWQLFAKRVRKNDGEFRYFHCGEYGDVNRRPHYHAILFGLDYADKVPLKETAYGTLYYSATLEKRWGLGQISLGSVTPQSAAYVAKYALKRHAATYTRTLNGHVWEVQKEYGTMSRNPPIGQTWYEKYANDIYPADECIVQGKRVKTPKLYDKLLKETHEHVHELIRTNRHTHALRNKRDNTPERRATRELVATRQTKDKRGTL